MRLSFLDLIKMDSGDDGRCLPSMWSRKGDRLDFMDMCASPPSDGFFYANNSHSKMNNKTHASKTQGNCSKFNEEKSTRETFITTPIQNSDESEGNCATSGSSAFFKSFVPSYQPPSGTSVTGELAPTEGFMVSGKILNMSSFELEKWAKDNVRGSHHFNSELASHDDISFDDSALTPADHQVLHLSPPKITKTDVGGSLNLVDKLSTPDVTPCSTPAVTPVCSPQVVRKSGNPFFAGDPARKDDGNWLFRSAPKETIDNTLYEAKVELQPHPNNQGLKKKVKYVPRPSHLRELNFWSPTSM